MYEFTELFAYKFVFIAELLIAMHLFFFRRKKRKTFALRVIVGVAVCMAFGYAYPIASYSAVYSSVMFFVLFFVCAASFAFIYDINVKEIFFLSVSAYTMQHFAHEVYALLANATSIVGSPTMGMYGSNPAGGGTDTALAWVNFLVYTEVYLVCYFAVYKLFGKKVNREDLQINNFHIAVIAALILVVDIVLNAVAVYIPGDKFGKQYVYLMSIYNLICCTLILYMQVNLCIRRDLSKELETVSMLFRESEKRYEQSEETRRLLNLKCHDLKHQIREYAGERKINAEYIADIVDLINIYDSSVDTGNSALNLILSEKSLFCRKNDITLTCFADCSKLGFISDADLYSLFGNILDNAIEAVTGVTQDGKRSINVIVKNVGAFASIGVDNYFAGGIVLGDDGLPRSKKGDAINHGYGLKSVSLITEKYGGDLKISVNGDVFSLMILFPVPPAPPEEI